MDPLHPLVVSNRHKGILLQYATVNKKAALSKRASAGKKQTAAKKQTTAKAKATVKASLWAQWRERVKGTARENDAPN